MPAFLVAFWKPIAGVLALVVLAIAIGVAKHGYDERRRDEGRADVQRLWDADRAERIQRTTDMTNLWDAKRQEAERYGLELDNERKARFELSAGSARNLPVSVSGVRVDHAAVRVLNDAIDAGDPAPIAGPAAKPDKAATAVAEGADSTVGLVTQWGVQCIAAYDDARGMVTGWQRFYAGLQAAQAFEVPP